MKVHGVCRVGCWDSVAGAQIGGEIMSAPLISENGETKEIGAAQ